jgi:outer membrane protein assembly factor BamA
MEGGGMYYRDDWHQNSSLQLNTGYLFPWQLSGRVSNYQEENLKQVKREVGVGVYLTSFLKIKLRRGEEKIQAEEMTLRKDSWGLDGNYNSVDDLFLPRQGIMVEVNFDWARREDLKFPQRKMTTNIRYFLPVSTNSILACRLLFSTYFLTHAEEEELFPFEYFKLGGMRNLRGFIEDQFRGTQVGLISLEYFFRFFFFFLDGGYVASPGQEIWPIGYGIGLRQKTKNRLISLCFGFGEGESLAEKFSLGKVHFQIKNIF